MNNSKSNFNNDKHAEEALSCFLDKYLYKPLVQQRNNILGFKRIVDKEMQLSGIDVVLQTRNGPINVDEKSTLQYINKDIPTFAMELSYKGKTGWFLKDDIRTDAYFLIWPHASTTNPGTISSEDFTKLNCMMIYKHKLKQYINKYITDQELISAAHSLENGNLQWPVDEKGRYHLPSNNELYLMISNRLYEKPVNLIIKKHILQQLCCSEVIIEKTGVKFMKGKK